MPTVGAFEAWATDLLPELSTGKIAPERFVESVGQGLHGAGGDVLAATTFEAARKVVLEEKPPGLPVMILDRFEHLVVQTTRLGKTPYKQLALTAVVIEPVLKSLQHLSSIIPGGCSNSPAA